MVDTLLLNDTREKNKWNEYEPDWLNKGLLASCARMIKITSMFKNIWATEMTKTFMWNYQLAITAFTFFCLKFLLSKLEIKFPGERQKLKCFWLNLKLKRVFFKKSDIMWVMLSSIKVKPGGTLEAFGRKNNSSKQDEKSWICNDLSAATTTDGWWMKRVREIQGKR